MAASHYFFPTKEDLLLAVLQRYLDNLRVELVESHPAARQMIARNFDGWAGAMESCLKTAEDRFPPGTDLPQLATFVLVVLEGALMLTRTHRQMESFDAAIDQLRVHFETLLAWGQNGSVPPADDTGSTKS